MRARLVTMSAFNFRGMGAVPHSWTALLTEAPQGTRNALHPAELVKQPSSL